MSWATNEKTVRFHTTNDIEQEMKMDDLETTWRKLLPFMLRKSKWTAETECETFKTDLPHRAADEIERLRQLCRDNGVSEHVIMGDERENRPF